MPKNPLKDYLWLIDELTCRPMTLAELQRSYYNSNANEDHKELQPKTLYNWRTKIEDIFSIKIEYVGDKYQIVDEGEPERKAALEWLVQSLSINTALSQSRELSKRILLENIPSGETYLRPIIKAMNEGRRIKIAYVRFNVGVGAETVVEPYCLKVNNRRWYMLCRVPDGHPHHDDYPYFDSFGCIRIYALDRIVKLETLDEKFVYPEDFDPDELFSNHFGVCIAYGVPLERVVVRFGKYHRDYIDTLPLHHSQQLVEEYDDGDGIYEFHLHPTIDFFRALLSFGTDAEVLAPQAFRKCFAEEAEILNDIYSTSDNDEEQPEVNS